MKRHHRQPPTGHSWRRAAAFLGLLGAVVVAACAPPGEPAASAPDSSPASQPANLVLVSIDTLRADKLGAYGHGGGLSPNVDRLAGVSTLYENAIAQAPHTIPSLLQIMSSRYAPGREIAASTPTLAKVLRSHGYATAAVVENPLLEIHPRAYGLADGFESFSRNGVLWPEQADLQLWRTNTPADALTLEALRAVDRLRGEQPFFLWVHYFDPHDPYLPPFGDDLDELTRRDPPIHGDVRATRVFQDGEGDRPLSDAQRRRLVELYEAEVRYVDRSLGTLLAGLEERGLFDGSVVALISDHGESLGEHGVWTHGRSLQETEIHVPWILKRPHQASPERRGEVVEAIDLVPTLLASLGLGGEGSGWQGADRTEPGAGAAFVFWRSQRVVRLDHWKLLLDGDRRRLYDLAADPGEDEDVAGSHAAVADRLEALLVRRLASLEGSERPDDEASEELVKSLRALGYL